MGEEKRKTMLVATDGGIGRLAARHGIDLVVMRTDKAAVREIVKKMRALLPPESPFSPGSMAGGSAAEERALKKHRLIWGGVENALDDVEERLKAFEDEGNHG